MGGGDIHVYKRGGGSVARDGGAGGLALFVRQRDEEGDAKKKNGPAGGGVPERTLKRDCG